MSTAQPAPSLAVLTFGGITIVLAAIAWLLIGFLEEASVHTVGSSGSWRPILAFGFICAVIVVAVAYANAR